MRENLSSLAQRSCNLVEWWKGYYSALHGLTQRQPVDLARPLRRSAPKTAAVTIVDQNGEHAVRYLSVY